jgi:hypothetical protein
VPYALDSAIGAFTPTVDTLVGTPIRHLPEAEQEQDKTDTRLYASSVIRRQGDHV